MSPFMTVARFVVLAVFVLAASASLASWLVRTRRVSPFGGLGSFLRRASDPIIRPVETRVVRMGGQPAQATFWLVVGVAILGIVLLFVLGVAESIIRASVAAAGGGPRTIIAFVVDLAFQVLMIALFIRVVASWLQMGRYNRWIRPTYALTDWIVEPLRRVLPPFGMLDLSPLVALVVLWLLWRFVYVVLL